MWRLLYGGLVLVLLVFAAWVVFFMPGRAFVARACPFCFGFEKASDEIYVEASASAAARADAASLVSQARVRVESWYGAPQSRPIFFFCPDPACARRLVPGYRGGVLGLSDAHSTILLLPGGNSAVIAAHEWSHAELKLRLGIWNFARAEVPAWFDEGLAVLVAGDERYLAPAVAAKVCPQQPTQAGLPTSERAWGPQAGRNHLLYARAACVVTAWLADRDGAAGLDGLIAGIKSGQTFSQVWAMRG
ncbi:MAG TPA: hypothetical protein VJS85_09685 [Rhizomicrobium sp.]|nr:hypothetical protein [Rhizomicrobium sp.]